MVLKETKQKILSNFIIIALILSSTAYFMLNFHFLRPNYDLMFLPYEEKVARAYDDKLELIGEERINPFDIFNFINDTVEDGSTVLYFNYSFWILGKPYLYPYVISDLIHYTDDEELFVYIDELSIDYIIIIEGPHHLANYTNKFSQTKYDSDIYLLEIK